MTKLSAHDRSSKSPNDGISYLTLLATVLILMPAGLRIEPLGAAGTPAGLLALGGLWIWAAGRIVPSLGLATGRQPVRWAIALLFISTFASYAAAFTRPIDPAEMRGADRHLLVVAASAGAALLAADGIRSRVLLEKLLKRIVILGTLVAGIGIFQFTTGIDIASKISLPGLVDVNLGVGFIQQRSNFNRVAATMSHPIEFSVVITMILPLAIHLALFSSGRAKKLWWACTMIVGTAVPMTLSRTATLGLVAVAIWLIPSWKPTLQRKALVACAAFAVVLRIIFPGLLGTMKYLVLGYQQDSSIEGRTSDFPFVAEFFAQRPLLGRGYGTFIPSRYFFLDNQYLGTLIEGGIVGLTVMLAVYLIGMSAGRGARHRSTDPSIKNLGQSLAACLAVPLFASAAFDFMAFPSCRGLAFILLGCCGAAWRISKFESLLSTGTVQRALSGNRT
ncbi:MAG: O-antigen ligase family protein [Actinomycetota bacterium]